MKNSLISIKNCLLDLLFPKFCVGCNCEGDYLCQDCQGLIDINYYQFCPVCNQKVFNGRTCFKCRGKTALSGLFFAVFYKNHLVKKLFSRFKYEARVKDISKILAGFVVDSFTKLQFFEKTRAWFVPNLPGMASRVNLRVNEGFVLVPVPLHKKKLKSRGFNQSEEIAKHLAKAWDIPLLSDVLIKSRKTISQTILDKEQREDNIHGAFSLRESHPFTRQRKGGDEIIQGKKVLLVDDIYTTGATMNECASALKRAGAKEVWGIAVARE